MQAAPEWTRPLSCAGQRGLPPRPPTLRLQLQLQLQLARGPGRNNGPFPHWPPRSFGESISRRLICTPVGRFAGALSSSAWKRPWSSDEAAQLVPLKRRCEDSWRMWKCWASLTMRDNKFSQQQQQLCAALIMEAAKLAARSAAQQAAGLRANWRPVSLRPFSRLVSHPKLDWLARREGASDHDDSIEPDGWVQYRWMHALKAPPATWLSARRRYRSGLCRRLFSSVGNELQRWWASAACPPIERKRN